MLAQVDLAAGPPVEYSMDKWAGYQADAATLVDFLARRKPSNPVVLTGDIHSHWVCDVKQDPRRPESATVATEFVGTSISSGGDGQELPPRVAAFLPDNPHVRFFNGQRGYVSCTVTPRRLAGRLPHRAVRDEARRPVSTAASFIVESAGPARGASERRRWSGARRHPYVDAVGVERRWRHHDRSGTPGSPRSRRRARTIGDG